MRKNLPEICSHVTAIVIKNGYQQVICKIIAVEQYPTPIEFKAIIKADSFKEHLSYNNGDTVLCKVIGYCDNGILISPLNNK
ncbi:hypothetical protein EBI_21955 [Enterocytozoon bieneusi H348]|nr:hypothetical protein EBI_21955 [Enterocytozoon bieneusi H348]|eukprot:XP_001828060.1 hypothetical protein EBI_21955 [Enterocytozoon bieneusi H348]